MALPLVVGAAGSLLARAISTTAIAGFIAKLLASIGIAVFTISGVDAAFDLVHTTLKAYMNGVAADVIAMIDIAGITTVISWIMGAYASRISIQAAKASIGLASKLNK